MVHVGDEVGVMGGAYAVLGAAMVFGHEGSSLGRGEMMHDCMLETVSGLGILVVLGLLPVDLGRRWVVLGFVLVSWIPMNRVEFCKGMSLGKSSLFAASCPPVVDQDAGPPGLS